MDTTKEPTDTTPTDAPATATTPEDRIATLERDRYYRAITVLFLPLQ